jgi:hypothetical protein
MGFTANTDGSYGVTMVVLGNNIKNIVFPESSLPIMAKKI